MEKFKNKYKVESIRSKNWDYSSDGYYFITICTKDRICCLGEIINDKITLSQQGKIVQNQWLNLPNHYKNCIFDEFIIMPNHLHGIVIIDNKNQPNMDLSAVEMIHESSLHGMMTEIIQKYLINSNHFLFNPQFFLFSCFQLIISTGDNLSPLHFLQLSIFLQVD